MSQTSTTARRRVPVRSVRARRVAFRYPPGTLPRHYVNDDLIMSHVVTMLSAMFPEGEDFFVRSVRHYRDVIVDPELKKQVAGFIGQEAMHGREHRTFNRRLHALGYPTQEIDRIVKWSLKAGGIVLPKRTQLAVTAALEHYTATIAEVLLASPEARAMLDVDEIRMLLLWHALEESEHKAVAFDVYQEVSGNDFVRAAVMHAVTAGFLSGLVLSTFVSMLADPASRDLRRVGRSVAALRRSPFLTPAVLRRLRAYSRRGFHPDDRDTAALISKWRTELFGADGNLVDRLKGDAELTLGLAELN